MKNLTLLLSAFLLLVSCTDYKIDSYSKKPLNYTNEYIEEIILADADTIFKVKVDVITGDFSYKQSPKLNLGFSLQRREPSRFKIYQVVYCSSENTPTINQYNANLPNNGTFKNYDFKHIGGYTSSPISYVQNKDQWLMTENGLSEKHRIDVIYKTMIRDNCPALHPDKITFIQNICNYDSSYQYAYTYNW